MKNFKTKLVAAFFCTSSIAFAQGIYVEINAGYGMPFNANKDIISELTSMYGYDSNGDFFYSDTYKNVNLSLGKGVNIGATFGYMFNTHLGAELQYSFLLGSSTEGSYSSVGPNSMYTYNTAISSRFSRVIPTIVLQSGFDKINPYAKIGVVLGFGSVNFETNTNDDGDISMMVSKYNGGMAIGLNTRFGVLIKGGGKLSYFAEFNFVGMNYSPTNGEVTSYTENGVNMLPSLTTSERLAEFSDEVTYSNDDDENQPSQESKFTLPFGSIGLNVGVRIDL